MRARRLDPGSTRRERPRSGCTANTTRRSGSRRILIKAGWQYAREGEVFGFEPREIRAERCEEVEIVLENTDTIRHDLIIPGLNPIFVLNLIGPKVAAGRFVTPDEDITLFFHCHIEAHDKVGMAGRLIVGRGGEPKRPTPPAPSTSGTFRGVGVVVATIPRAGRLIVNHEEIPGFMAAMEMSFSMASPSLLSGLNPSDRIQCTIDAARSVITAIDVVQAAQ